MDDINAEIGRNIRRIRKKNKMTLSEVADRLAQISPIVVGANAVGRWERGEVILQAATVQYLSIVLECEVSALMPHDTSSADAKMISLLEHMPQRDKETMLYIAHEWDGDRHALIEFVRMYISLSRHDRVDVSGLAINQVIHLVNDRGVKLALDVDLKKLERMNREIER